MCIRIQRSFTSAVCPRTHCFFTMLLLGRSRSSAPFQDVFSISVVLSLSAVLWLSNNTTITSKDFWSETSNIYGFICDTNFINNLPKFFKNVLKDFQNFRKVFPNILFFSKLQYYSKLKLFSKLLYFLHNSSVIDILSSYLQI